MLTTDLFDKLNLNKNYDFPFDILELPANLGNGEGEFRGKIPLRIGIIITTVNDHLLNNRHGSKHVIELNSSNPNNSLQNKLSFHRWGKQTLLSNLP